MAIAKKILIEMESRETFIVRVNGHSGIRAFCGDCAAMTEVLTVDEAVASSGMSTLRLMEKVREGEIHFLQTASGHLLICNDSIRQKEPEEGIQSV